MADETRKEEGIEQPEPETPELDDQVLEDVSGGAEEDSNNNINN